MNFRFAQRIVSLPPTEKKEFTCSFGMLHSTIQSFYHLNSNFSCFRNREPKILKYFSGCTTFHGGSETRLTT